MTWRAMLFAHWPYDPATVAARLPDGLEPHVYDGRAWVGVVAHRMDNVGPPGVSARSFVEVNVRTYVRRGDRTGVHFLSLDASDGLAVAIARRLWGLPYYRSEARIRSNGATGAYRVDGRRTHPGAGPARVSARYVPDGGDGEPSAPEAGTLGAFLTDRYRFFVDARVGRLRGRLRRAPIPVTTARAEVAADSLVTAADLPAPDGDPHCLFGAPDGVPVRAGPPRRGWD